MVLTSCVLPFFAPVVYVRARALSKCLRAWCVSTLKELSEAVIEANPDWVRIAGRFGEVGRALDAAADNHTNINNNVMNTNTNANTNAYLCNSTNTNAHPYPHTNTITTASVNHYHSSYSVGEAHSIVSDAIYFPDLIAFDNDSAEEKTEDANSNDTITANDIGNDFPDLIAFGNESEDEGATRAGGLTAVTGSPGPEGWGKSVGGVRGRTGGVSVPPGLSGVPVVAGSRYDAPPSSGVSAPPGLGAPFVNGAGFGAVVETAPRAAALAFVGDSSQGSSFVRGGGGGRDAGGWSGWGGPGAGDGGLTTWGVAGGSGHEGGGGGGGRITSLRGRGGLRGRSWRRPAGSRLRGLWRPTASHGE